MNKLPKTNDPSKLFRILAAYQGNSLDEKTPAKYAAEYYDYIFNNGTYAYKGLLDAVNAIVANSKNPKHDITSFIKGAILSTPYGLNEYTAHMSAIADSKYANITVAINSWLNDRFKETHPDIYTKLDHLAYVNENTPFDICSSMNPTAIQQVVRQTNACIHDDPLSFFEQVVLDVGTVYLLAVQRDQKVNLENMKKGTPNVGYVRLYPYQSADKKETVLSVDNIWINNNNKNLVCSIVDSLVDLSKHLELPVIDKTMSKNYIIKNGHLLDIYDQTQTLFKLGHTPEIMRYNKLAMPVDNDGFYIIKSMKKCK